MRNEVPHYGNMSNPSLNFVTLYEKYISKCPPNAEFLFLQSHPEMVGTITK